jgi:hypothetical protein
MEFFLSFVQANNLYFDAAQAISSVVNRFAWYLAPVLLILALRKNPIKCLSVGPLSFSMLKQKAITATATATRAPQSGHDCRTTLMLRDTLEALTLAPEGAA